VSLNHFFYSSIRWPKNCQGCAAYSLLLLFSFCRLNACESRCENLPRVQQQLEETERALGAVQEEHKIAVAELASTSRALESLLASLDARKQYDTLLKAHESGKTNAQSPCILEETTNRTSF